MRRIIKIKSESTNLYSEFQSVQWIEIGAKIGGGNFGDVFECLSVNGLSPLQPQVIKILHNQNRIAEPGLETIKNLQKKLGDFHKKIAQTGVGLLEQYPAFLGCPQFSFRGELNGEEVIGYSANNLTKLGFIEFERILKEPEAFGYDILSMRQRYLIAWHLAAAFDVLRQCFYIHADLKAEAIFIDLKNYRCAIIDYDSGAVIQKKDDKPSTIGTPQEWWAPEIIKQSNQMVRVNIYSDIWSLNMGIHSILFTFFPLKFFTEVSANVMDEYLKSYQFPQLDLNESYVRPEPELHQLHSWYIRVLQNDVTPDIAKKIKTNIQLGFFNPTQRVTASQWKTVLQVTQPLPEIKFFRPDRQLVTDARPVRFEWEVENASIILVNGSIVTGESYIDIAIRKDQVVELEAISPFGYKKIKSLIEVSKEKPTIEYFDCERTLRVDYRPSKLRWKVTNAALVEIDQGIGSVLNEGEYEVMPRRETIYTLKAVTLFGIEIFSKVTIKVLASPPQITRFKADKIYLTQKETVRLSWETHNAEFVTIDQGIGNVSGQRYVDVIPQGTTEYTLTATSFFDIEKTAHTIVLVPKIAPRLISFKSDRRIISDNIPVRLSWEVRDAEKIEILGLGEVTSLPYLDVQPQQDTVYVLQATGPFGGVTEARHRITTSRKPPSVTFRASSVQIKKGHSAKIIWNVGGAISITINLGIGHVGRRGVMTVVPDEDITYTLIAKSFYGIETRAYITIRVLRPPSLIRPQITLRNIPMLNRSSKKQP